MAVNWYLLKDSSGVVSGFDNDEYNDSAVNTFADALGTNIAYDVDLLNYDLSECKHIKAIIQNNVQDTRLKTLSRQALVPIGTCKAGMYIRYKNRYWLIVGLVDDNTMYEKAILSLCNHLLTWVNDRGQVVQRWANVSSASQYNHGETSTDNYWTRTDQLMILTPDDDECLLIKTSQRFIIDKRCSVYEKNFDYKTEKDVSKPVIVYKLTRADSVLYDYQDSGYYAFMAYQDEQKEDDGYYIINGKGYWLCQHPVVNDKNIFLSCSIVCESTDLYDGLDAGEFKAVFRDLNGNIVTITPNWQIVCDFIEDLNVSYIDNAIFISVDNPKLINKSFELSLDADGYKKTTITITIKAFL